MLNVDADIIFQFEKFYLDLNQQNSSPQNIMLNISKNYNIPINELSDQIDILNGSYEKEKSIFLSYYNTPEFSADFNQLFYTESPTDFSPAIYLYLFIYIGNSFKDDEIAQKEEFTNRKNIISQILADDFENLKDLDNVHTLTEYLWHYPSTNNKKWISILILYHAEQLTDALFSLLNKIKKEYSKLKDPISDLADIDLYSENSDKLLAKLLGDTSGKEIIRVPSVTGFNALKFIEEKDDRIYVFIGVLYNSIGDLISKYSNSDKVIVSRLKTIGESSRLEILKQLRKGPMCGKDIAELLNLTPATVSHHMSSLVNEGLVYMYKTGTRIDYKINSDEAKKLIDSLKHIFF